MQPSYGAVPVLAQAVQTLTQHPILLLDAIFGTFGTIDTEIDSSCAIRCVDFFRKGNKQLVGACGTRIGKSRRREAAGLGILLKPRLRAK